MIDVMMFSSSPMLEIALLSSSLLQENSQDSTVKKLREVIQKCESDGLVDIDLGGHTYTRPPSVVQGSATDQ